MKVSFYISQRWIKTHDKKKSLSSPIIRLGIAAVALSIAVMIISIAVVTGFQEEIRNRVVGFGSHIQILNLDSNNSYETNPIPSDLPFLEIIKFLPGVKHVQAFATKPGIIKTSSDIQGIIAKGIDTDFNWSFFENNIITGNIFSVSDTSTSNQVLLSSTIANQLNLNVGDKFATYFIDEKPRARAFTISGIYKTSLQEFDKQIMLVDIKHIQKLNKWSKNQITGFEIFIHDYNQIDHLTHEIRNTVGYQFLDDGSRLKIVPITDKFYYIFDWLKLLDLNIVVILVIMSIISIINMISVIIIIILDKISAIGLLKAMGTNNKSIKQIFLYHAAYIIGRGLLFGNTIALTIGFIQEKYHILKLNQASYFIDYAPVNFKMGWLLLLNIIALILILTCMLLPAMMISRVEPVKTIRYE